MRRIEMSLTKQHALAICAYGCFLACTSVILWGGYTRFLEGFTGSEYLLLEYFVRGSVFPLSLFVVGVVAFVFPRAERWRSPLIALAVLFLGGICVLGQQILGVVSLPVLMVAAACFGWGSGLLFCALQQILASLKVFEAGIVVFAAAGVSALLFFVVELLPDTIVPWVALLVLVPLTIGLVMVARRMIPRVHPMFDIVPRQQLERCQSAVEELWKPLLCIAFSAFIVGIVRVGTTGGDGVLGQTNESNMVGLLVSSVVLLASWKYLYSHVKLIRLYQIMFPLTATAFLLLPLLEGSYRQVFVSFVFLVFSVTSSLMVVSCARSARNQCLPPVLVYGLFAGAVYACSIVGSLVGLVVGAGKGAGFAELTVVALVAVYILSMTMMVNRRGRAKSREQLPVRDTMDHPEFTTHTIEDNDNHCSVIVERYALTAREKDVLVLLARGRDVPYIAEELVISKNTVRSHIKNIFSKAGVHSRQELIDLVELSEG